jgi:hypothetical protein
MRPQFFILKKQSKDKADTFTHKGLQKIITATNFILHLGLMYGALQELSNLSMNFHERDLDLYMANKKNFFMKDKQF